jgi:adenylate kinase
MLLKHGKSVNQVLALEVDEEELVKRLLKRSWEQGRTDDTEEVVKNRLVQYHQHTKPLIDYYLERGVYKEVHGVGTIDDIYNQLLTEINTSN